MAGDDYVDAVRGGIDPQGLEIVHDEDGSVGKSHASYMGKFAGPAARIHVPSDGCDRCDPAKRVDDFGTSISPP
jgi:hypothetical protein